MAVTARGRGTANSEPNSTRGHVAASAHRGGGRGGETGIGGFLRSGTRLAQSMLPRGQPEIPEATVTSVCCRNMAWIRAAQPRKVFCRILTPDFLEVFRFSHDQRRKKGIRIIYIKLCFGYYPELIRAAQPRRKLLFHLNPVFDVLLTQAPSVFLFIRTAQLFVFS